MIGGTMIIAAVVVVTLVALLCDVGDNMLAAPLTDENEKIIKR